MIKAINILAATISVLACEVADADQIYVIPIGTPTTINYKANLAMFGAIGALIESTANAESSKMAEDRVQSATSQAGPQVYFAAKFTEKLVACGRDASFLDQIVSEQTKYPDWVDTKKLTDESAFDENDGDIYIEAFVDRLVVKTSLLDNQLLGAAAIKIYDAHTKKLINQYRDYTLVSGKETLPHYSSGSEQEKTDELVQATKKVLDYVAGTLGKKICSAK